MLVEVVVGSMVSTAKIAVIATSFIVVVEFLRAAKVLDHVSTFLGPVERLFNMRHEGMVPLFVGFLFGIVNGAGVLRHYAREDRVSKNDLALVALFISTCHAFIEDSIIFVAVGASAFWMFGTRFAIAVAVTAIAGHALLGWWLVGERRPKQESV